MNQQLKLEMSDGASNPRFCKGAVIASAVLSDCGKYRYSLSRVWDESKPKVLFIMLNPSTADAEQDDPTIRLPITSALQKIGVMVGFTLLICLQEGQPTQKSY